MIMCEKFSNLTRSELNQVHKHLVAICEILNPLRHPLTTLAEHGFDTELQFELDAIQVFHELCKRERV